MKTILPVLSLLFVSLGPLRADERPNIVFFFTDDQTTSTIGCYGNRVVETPNIDSLAARGMRFENAFVSHSICWVSRTTILSGLTGRSYGTAANPEQARPDAVATLYSDILRGGGYRTGYFGKWHAKMPNGYRKEDHFDEFEAIGRNPYYKKQADGSLRHETELIVDRGIEFLKSQPKDKPFALNMWFNACHAEDSDRRPGIGHFPWPRTIDDGMYEDIEIAPPRLERSGDLRCAARLFENDHQSRTLLLAVEYRAKIPNQYAGVLSHGQRDRWCHRPFHRRTRRSRIG